MCEDIVYSDCLKAKPVTKYLIISTFICCYFLSLSAFAADDDYLKALEVEAEKSAHLNEKGDNTKKNKPVSILNKNEFIKFEKVLRASRPATYRFYKKLNKQDKTVIYSIYKEDHKLTRASKTVLDIYFNKKY